MKPSIALIVSFSLLTPAVTRAQPGNSGNTPAAAKAAADGAWSRIAPSDAVGQRGQRTAPTTVEQAQASVSGYAQQQKAVAQTAREFQVAHPSDERVPQAKKIEVTGLLRAAWPPSGDDDKVALQRASAFAADGSNPAKDRFEVMALALAQDYRLRHRGATIDGDARALEQTAELLSTQFGDIPEVVKYQLTVADAGDPATGYRAAQRVLDSDAPPELKRQAQTLIERHALIGSRPNISLRETGGRLVNLRQAARPTMIYVWSARLGGPDWSALEAAKRAAPVNTQWVFVALDTTAAELAAATSRASFQATHCRLENTARATFAKGLKIRRLPYVYALERGGNLADYGRPIDLKRLVDTINR